MDIEKVFHMKGGNGDTSYSKNSSLQKRVADKVKHITLQAMEEMLEATSRPKSIGIADLGCSSGPNTLSNIKQLVQTVEINIMKKQLQQQQVPEFRIYLNDLPTNDFNTIFQALPDLYRDLNKRPNNDHHQIYIAGYPGTFYGRLFPDNCLHFVYSSNSLHWLSTVPRGIYDENGGSKNKESIYISERSPLEVSEAYRKQFREDFSMFLKSRSREVVMGGRMVLILLGRNGDDDDQSLGNSFFWEILYQSLAILVHQGEIEEEKLESYEVHFYAPSKEELEEEVRKEGSFKVELVEMFEMDKNIVDASGNSNIYPSYGVAVAKTVRSIQESMLASHFGEAILDKLFDLYGKLVDQELAKHDDDDDIIKSITTVLVLTKL